MQKLEEMLKEEGDLWFVLGGGKYDCRRFLYWAKKQGIKWWPKGREIKKTDDCSFYVALIKNKMIANISAMCVVHIKNKPKHILMFKDFLREIKRKGQ